MEQSGDLTTEERWVSKLLTETFGLEPVGLNFSHNFFLLGFDSLMLIRLRESILGKLECNLDVEQFYGELDSPANLATYLKGRILSKPAEIKQVNHAEPCLNHAAGPDDKVSVDMKQGNRTSADLNAFIGLGNLSPDQPTSLNVLTRIFAQQIKALGDVCTAQLDFLVQNHATSINDPRPVQQSQYPSAPAVTPSEPTLTSFPMSTHQQRLYSLCMAQPDRQLYQFTCPLWLNGPLDRSLLAKAVQSLVAHHAGMRTSFAIEGDELVQRVTSHLRVSIEYRDCTGESHETVLAQFIRPFDLSKAPLFRVGLFQFGSDRHLLVFDKHHLITDGMSTQIMVKDLLQLLQGQQLDPAASCADFAAWEQTYIGSTQYQEHARFWLKRFPAGQQAFRLTSETPQPGSQEGGGVVRRHVANAVFQNMRRLSQLHRLSSQMVLLAAANLLLARLTGRQLIAMGIPVDVRPEGFLRSIGMFANTIVLSNPIDPKQSLSDFLTLLKQRSLDAYEARRFPFDHLVGKLGLVGTNTGNPMFDCLFVYEYVPKREAQIGKLHVSPYDHTLNSIETDLEIEWLEEDQGLHLNLIYDGSRFSLNTIEGWADQLIRILTNLVEGNALPRSLESFIQLPTDCATKDHLPSQGVLTPEEIQLQLLTWNATTTDHDQNVFFSDRFHSHSLRLTDRLAVTFAGSDHAYTYGELNRRAYQLAHHLRSMSCRPETTVTVCLERGPDMLLSMLAIFAAGGVYVPLHPNDPSERAKVLLEETGSTLMITTVSLAKRFQLPSDCQLILMDQAQVIFQGPSHRPQGTLLSPDQLAYMIFTSGSTGKPKGAMLSHRGMLNHLRSKLVDLSLSEADKVAQNASQSFDISIWQFLVAPLVGGITHVIPDSIAHDPVRLITETAQSGVTILEVVPSLFQSLFGELDPQSLPPLPQLRFLLQTGEALPVHLCARWFEVYPEIPIVNAYGPTECSDDVTMYTLTRLPKRHPQQIPIGFPIINTQAYLLGNQLQLIPHDATGELWIGGVGVGRGYRNRPGQTAERFCPDPFAKTPGSRLYRTGDLVRRARQDQPIGPTPAPFEYLGRIDFQVKIRGYRIELGEIEGVLGLHPDLVHVVVLAQTPAGGDPRLVAWFVPKPGTNLQDRTLRDFAAEKLPSYMVPSLFVPIATVPVTQNGKLDRAALPDPDREALQPEFQSLEDETDLNNVDPILLADLVQLWRRILKRPDLTETSGFFESGGNSIKAIVLITKIQEELQREVDLAQLFQAGSPIRLAARLGVVRAKIQTHIPLIPPASYYPCSGAQTRLWLACQRETGSRAYCNYDAFLITGPLDPVLFEQAFAQMVTRHEIHRTTFHSIGGQLQMRVHPPGPVSVPLEDLRNDPPSHAELAERYLAESAIDFDLEHGPLLRLKLLRLPDEDGPRHLLFFSSHHIISDGWSTDIFSQELFSIYAQLRQGKPANLPELPIQYKDYASWINQQLTEEALADHHQYWERQLFELPEAPALGTDFPRTEIQDSRGRLRRYHLGAERSQAVYQSSQAHGVSVFVFLQTLVKAWLHHKTGHEDLVVGAPFSGRIHPDLERQIGFFLNLLPLRNRVQDSMRFVDLLKEVQNITLDATLHELYPFDQLVEAFWDHPSNDRHPFFDVLVNMVNFDFLDRDYAGLQIGSFFEESAGSKVDLNIVFEDHGSLSVSIEYKEALFHPDTIYAMASELFRLADIFTSQPSLTLEEAHAQPATTEAESFLSAAMAIDEDF